MSAEPQVNILTYHSIADGPPPLAIAPSTFRMQLDALVESGFHGVSLRTCMAAGISEAARRRFVVLTFDDGYRDFVETALPELQRRGFSCTLFLSSGLVGDAGGWDPDGLGRRQLLDWDQAAAVAAGGVELGAHGVTHANLARLEDEDMRQEVTASGETIAQRTRQTVASFAAPYGSTTPAIRAEIARRYTCAVGTNMAPADADSDPYDLPRIDMWYFRDPSRWRQYLNGASGYFAFRRTLRQARQLLRRAAGGR